MQVAALQRQSMSLRKGVVMPAEDAIEIAVDSGLLPEGAVSVDYYNRWLRRNAAARRDQTKETPHVELRSLGPNHVHQMDFSLAVNWKCFQEQGAAKIRYEHLIYKNKLPEAGQARLWRVVVSDHASGAFFVWYAQSRGETVQATLEALYRAWVRKETDVERKYPFRGHPENLDGGPRAGQQGGRDDGADGAARRNAQRLRGTAVEGAGRAVPRVVGRALRVEDATGAADERGAAQPLGAGLRGEAQRREAAHAHRNEPVGRAGAGLSDGAKRRSCASSAALGSSSKGSR